MRSIPAPEVTIKMANSRHIQRTRKQPDRPQQAPAVLVYPMPPLPDPPNSELILVNLGTPTAPTPAAVRAFLGEFLSDPMVVDKPRWLWLPILHGIILRRRPKPIAKAYSKIWGATAAPLAMGTLALAEAVHAATNPGVKVSHAFRYGAPNLKQRLAESLAAYPDSNHPIHIVPLFPQRTSSSSETIVQLGQQLATRLPNRLVISRINPASPGYITALASGIRAARKRASSEHLVVSFHSIPQSVNRKENECYTKDCQATFEALLRATDTNPSQATLSFQSRFGRDPWVGPATEETLVALAHSGTDSVTVCAPGFLTAGLETMEELGIRAQAKFRQAGGKNFSLAQPPVEPGDPPRASADLVDDICKLAQ